MREVAINTGASPVIATRAGKAFSQGAGLQDTSFRAWAGVEPPWTLCFGDEVAVGKGCTQPELP